VLWKIFGGLIETFRNHTFSKTQPGSNQASRVSTHLSLFSSRLRRTVYIWFAYKIYSRLLAEIVLMIRLRWICLPSSCKLRQIASGCQSSGASRRLFTPGDTEASAQSVPTGRQKLFFSVFPPLKGAGYLQIDPKGRVRVPRREVEG